MLSSRTSWQFYEIIEVVNWLHAAARPRFCDVSKDRLPSMVTTSCCAILFINEILLGATYICTDKPRAILRHHRLFALIVRFKCSLSLFSFLLSVEVVGCLHYRQVLLLACITGIGHRAAAPEAFLSHPFGNILVISVFAHATTFEFFKFGPFICNLITARPSFFQIMKDRLSRVEIACGAVVCGL